jgi:hypothetical protein
MGVTTEFLPMVSGAAPVCLCLSELLSLRYNNKMEVRTKQNLSSALQSNYMINSFLSPGRDTELALSFAWDREYDDT